MSIKSNIKEAQRLTLIAKEHLIGGKLNFTKDHVLFVFHCSHEGLNGVRVSLEKGKINALMLLLNKLDFLYNKEFGWSSHHTTLKSI